MLWQSSLSVGVLAAAGSFWTWFSEPDIRPPEIGQSRAQAEASLGQFAFFGRTCFGELAVFTDRNRDGREEHVMAFLDERGKTVIATEVQTEAVKVTSAMQCRRILSDQLRSAAVIRKYDSGARQRFFVRTKRKDGVLRELWADFADDGAHKTCELFDRLSTADRNRLSADGEWLLPGNGKTAVFDPFASGAQKRKPGS